MTAFIGTNTISPQFLSDEFTLTIALVVFVMLTAILLTLLIALAASKNFRKVFFRDKPKKADKKSHAADKNAETTANAQGASVENAPEYYGGVMTVPIGAPIEKRGGKKQQSRNAEPDIYDKIATVAIPEPDKHIGSVYTIRTTTNARSKTAAKPVAPATAKRPASTAAAKGTTTAKTTTAVKDKKPTSSDVTKKR